MKTKRREIEGISLSFLDVISCGFGALILLLVLTKVFEPVVIEQTVDNLEGYVAALQQQLNDIRGETDILNREMVRREDRQKTQIERLTELTADLAALKSRYQASIDRTNVTTIVEGQLSRAKQSLTEEMQRLLADYQPSDDSLIGGVPVDSEYVIFIIDNSGSMQFAWPVVMRKVQETLDVHPVVKGMQVMNDMGTFMFRTTAGDWIRDTPTRRQQILERMQDWQDFSNSSPVEGITRAISSYYQPGRKISLYVFGDDFRGRSFQQVVDTVDKINSESLTGERLVRIHGIGFPTWFTQTQDGWVNAMRFSILMKILCERNGGTFVGLTQLQEF